MVDGPRKGYERQILEKYPERVRNKIDRYGIEAFSDPENRIRYIGGSGEEWEQAQAALAELQAARDTMRIVIGFLKWAIPIAVAIVIAVIGFTGDN